MIRTGVTTAAVLTLLLGAAGPAAGQRPEGRKEGKVAPGKTPPGKARTAPPGSADKAEPDCSGFYWSWPTRARAYLGVELLRLTGELRAHFGAPAGAGLLVARVEPKSPADRAGIKVGDLLVELDGRPTDSMDRVVWAIRRRARGDRVSLKVIRNGKPRLLQAALDVRETPQVEVGAFFKSFPGGVGFEGRDWKFDPRCLQRTMQRLQRQMKNAPPGRRIFRFLEREEDLERRLQQMEKKLHKLERRLGSGGSGA